jgi:hypothetical protein
MVSHVLWLSVAACAPAFATACSTFMIASLVQEVRNAMRPTGPSQLVMPLSEGPDQPAVPHSGSAGNSNIGAIVGGAVGGALALVALCMAVACLLFCRQRRKRTQSSGWLTIGLSERKERSLQPGIKAPVSQNDTTPSIVRARLGGQQPGSELPASSSATSERLGLPASQGDQDASSAGRIMSSGNTTHASTLGSLPSTTGLAPTKTVDVGVTRGSMLALERPLDNLMAMRPPGLFNGRFTLLRERTRGGQALVQMAHDADGGFYQYAIKCAFPECMELTHASASIPCHACAQLSYLFSCMSS